MHAQQKQLPDEQLTMEQEDNMIVIKRSLALTKCNAIRKKSKKNNGKEPNGQRKLHARMSVIRRITGENPHRAAWCDMRKKRTVTEV
jgi:hypothetical protein